MHGSGLERFVLRHLVDDDGLHSLLPALLLRMDSDRHGDASGRYAVTTLYCEPADTSARPRRRLRARLIDGPRGPRTFVEIRHHVGRRSWKLRTESTAEQAVAACRGEWLPGAPRLLQEAAALVRELGLEPACLVSASRRAFVGEESESDLRVTIDSRLRYRSHDLVLRGSDGGDWTALLAPGQHLLEIQVARAVPAWLVHALARAGSRETAPGRRQLVRLAEAAEEQAPRSATG